LEIVRQTAQIRRPDAACTSCKRENSPSALRNTTFLIGQQFGRLTVKAFAGYSEDTKLNKPKWLCQCSCGNEVTVQTGNLTGGKTKSCGCFGREMAARANTRHGLYKHPLYPVWWAMKERCYNPDSQSYFLYGQRGITICDEWLEDFSNFYAWAMDNGYGAGLCIERINNDGNYEPDNCRWATRKEQARNTRRTRIKPEDLEKIKKDPRSNHAVAQDYGVNASTISRIRTGSTWS